MFPVIWSTYYNKYICISCIFEVINEHGLNITCVLLRRFVNNGKHIKKKLFFFINISWQQTFPYYRYFVITTVLLLMSLQKRHFGSAKLQISKNPYISNNKLLHHTSIFVFNLISILFL